jgi:hypothetical protein
MLQDCDVSENPHDFGKHNRKGDEVQEMPGARLRDGTAQQQRDNKFYFDLHQFAALAPHRLAPMSHIFGFLTEINAADVRASLSLIFTHKRTQRSVLVVLLSFSTQLLIKTIADLDLKMVRSVFIDMHKQGNQLQFEQSLSGCRDDVLQAWILTDENDLLTVKSPFVSAMCTADVVFLPHVSSLFSSFFSSFSFSVCLSVSPLFSLSSLFSLPFSPLSSHFLSLLTPLSPLSSLLTPLSLLLFFSFIVLTLYLSSQTRAKMQASHVDFILHFGGLFSNRLSRETPHSRVLFFLDFPMRLRCTTLSYTTSSRSQR